MYFHFTLFYFNPTKRFLFYTSQYLFTRSTFFVTVYYSILHLNPILGWLRNKSFIVFSSLSALTALGNSSSFMVLNVIYILTSQIIISSPNLSPKVQTHISNFLLNISICMSSRDLKIICPKLSSVFPLKLSPPTVFPISTSSNFSFQFLRLKNLESFLILHSHAYTVCQGILLDNIFRIHLESGWFLLLLLYISGQCTKTFP